MRKLLGDDLCAQKIRSALEAGISEEPFFQMERVALASAQAHFGPQ